jgi:hypothetical protein
MGANVRLTLTFSLTIDALVGLALPLGASSHGNDNQVTSSMVLPVSLVLTSSTALLWAGGSETGTHGE